MNKFKKFFKNISATDIVVLVFFIFLSSLNLIFHRKIEYWQIILSVNILFMFFVVWISLKAYKKENSIWEIIHFYYIIPLIFFSFKEVYILLRAIHSVDYDYLLINADRFLFGTDPTVFLFQYSHPIITEILQIAYGSFFFLPILLGIEFHLKKDYLKFKYVIFLSVFGFLLSYAGYFMLPAVGPRFTLHTFETTNIELPGLFLTNFLREIVNAGESIPSGTLNPIQVVQRDVFPSGHTQMTLIVMFLAVKLKSKYKIFFLVDGALLIFATVYLRYHYVIDLIGGSIFMLTTIIFGKQLFNWWQKKNNEPSINY